MGGSGGGAAGYVSVPERGKLNPLPYKAFLRPGERAKKKKEIWGLGFSIQDTASLRRKGRGVSKTGTKWCRRTLLVYNKVEVSLEGTA